MGLDVRFIVIFLSEKKNLCLTTRLLSDILISGVDQSKPIGCEMKTLGIEGDEDLPDEFFLQLAQAGRVVCYEWFLKLLSASVHHFSHFPQTHLVLHTSFEPARQ